VTGDHDVTPERLAGLVDGATPETDAERDAVALMADLRGLAEPAPDAVRERVRGIATRETPGTAGWRRWFHGPDGRRRLALTAAPVAAAVVALAIAIPVLNRDDGGSAPPAAADAASPGAEGAGARGAAGASGGGAAAPEAAAPRAAVPAAPDAAASSATATATDALRAAEPAPADAGEAATAAELDRAVARARTALEDAGATGVQTREAAGGTAATVVAEVPADQVEDATTALERQGARVTTEAGADAGTAIVRATVTAGG
jgi:hypothetical protein